MKANRRLGEGVLTLAIGTLGGVLFDSAGVPAGWLAGSMAAVATAAILSLPVALPLSLCNIAFVVLGTMIGTTVDRRSLEALPEWPVSVAGLAVAIVVLLAVIPVWLQRYHGIDRRTAQMCAMPGAMSFVILHAIDIGADSRRVAILQVLRLASMLMIVPSLFALAYGTGTLTGLRDSTPLEWPLALALVAVGYAVFPVARKLRIPAPAFMVPMFVSAGISLSGWFERGVLPAEFLWPALVVSGSVIGTRFRGTSSAYLWESAKAGLGSVVLAVIVTGTLAWPVAEITSLPFIQVLLAYAPGGFEVMTVLSLSLGMDPAFVAGHQLLRYLAVCVALPFLFRKP